MDTNKFVNRHVGISAEDIPAMLETIGVKSLDELIDQTIPANIRLKEPLNLPEAMTEREFAEHIAELASKNEVFTSYIGMGWYDTVCPAPIQRNVFENPVWYTSYTPYQAEVSQELPDCYQGIDRITFDKLLATRRGDSGSRGGYHVPWFT